MPWVRFSDKFDWRVPGPRLVIRSHAAGATLNVPRPCAAAAKAAGKAVSVRAPRKGEDPALMEALDGPGSDGG